MLQRYIYACCQIPNCGGLIDKPGKRPDYYHTCYVLSGLSLCQYDYILDEEMDISVLLKETSILGEHSNLVKPIHPVHNITMDAVLNIKNHFLQYFSSLNYSVT
jgi:protein farnesyltransferase subunit beta